MKIWSGVLLIAFMLSTACGDGTPPTPKLEVTPDPDGMEGFTPTAIVEKIVAESAVKESAPKLEATPNPSGMGGLTPTAIVEKIVAESTVKESTTLDSGPKINCVLNKEENQITCMSTNVKEGSQLKWTSTAADAHGGGSTWQFTIYEQPVGNVAQVFLDICQGSTCQTFETSIDTSELGSMETHRDTVLEATTPTGPTSKKTLSAPPVLDLPFTTDHEPTGMMPMGETILHPVTPDNPGGHPGIDFQWHYQTELIAATNGEVIDIITSKPRRSLLYHVFVMSGDFAVTYDVVDLYSFNPNLDVGSKILSGQVMGYVEMGGDDGHTSTHWAFGTWRPGTGKPNPEGVVEKFIVDYICPVPYFSETERLRLFRLWDSAIYPDAGEFKGAELKERFPEVCNGPYKNY